MKKIILLVGLFFVLSSSNVFAKEGLYFKIAATLSSVEDIDVEYMDTEVGSIETDTGMGVSIAAGMQFGAISAEIEYAHRSVDVDKATILSIDVTDLLEEDDITSDVVMINLIYEMGETFKPYVLAGIGLGWVSDTDGAEFAYQIGGGASYPITSNTDFYGEYKYLASSDLEDDVDENLKYSFDSHNFHLGLKYSF